MYREKYCIQTVMGLPQYLYGTSTVQVVYPIQSTVRRMSLNKTNKPVQYKYITCTRIEYLNGNRTAEELTVSRLVRT